MKKIMILGCCGAGKSTLAKALHQITGLELVHLDQHYFTANWVEPPTAVWEEKVKQLAQKESWIIDGNYGGTLDIRLAAADTIILLNYSTRSCLQRVLLRTWKNLGKERAEMPPGCKERFNLPFLHYVLTFNRVKLPRILRKIKSVDPEKKVYILPNDRAVQDFLTQVAS